MLGIFRNTLCFCERTIVYQGRISILNHVPKSNLPVGFRFLHAPSSFFGILSDECSVLKAGVTDDPIIGDILDKHKLLSLFPLLQKRAEKFAELEECEKMFNDFRSNEEKDMKLLAEDELRYCKEDLSKLESQILRSILSVDSYDSDDVIVEVLAGVGGQEAMLFAADIFHLYEKYAAFRGWNFTVSKYDKSDIGGIRAASAEMNGNGIYSFMKFEAGVHRVQRVPKTERTGRIHTSTTAVAVLPKPADIEVVLDKKDLRIEACRSSSKGGQNANKSDTAIRVVHIPTGLAVECQETKVQAENKERAMERLATLLYQQQHDAVHDKASSSRRIQIGSRSRSDKIRTYNFVQDRITDHRISDTRHNIEEFFMGTNSLHDLICKVSEEYQQEGLNELIEKVLSLRSSVRKANKITS